MMDPGVAQFQSSIQGSGLPHMYCSAPRGTQVPHLLALTNDMCANSQLPAVLQLRRW